MLTERLPDKRLTPAEAEKKAKEEGRCSPDGRVRNTEPCYCSDDSFARKDADCGTEEKGNYCVNKRCEQKPLCTQATREEDIIQENCICDANARTACDKSMAKYCCATTKKCENDFNKCVTSASTTEPRVF